MEASKQVSMIYLISSRLKYESQRYFKTKVHCMMSHLYCNCGHNEERETKPEYILTQGSLLKLEFCKFNSPKQPPDVIRENNSQMTVCVASIFLVWSLLI